MNKSVLITGVSGSGKSFICEELGKLGYKSYDIEEIDGLFNMVHKETGKITSLDMFDNQDMEVVKQHNWVCDKVKMQKLVDKNLKKSVLSNVVFYCGTASNTEEIFSLFDFVILLKASEETIRKRLSNTHFEQFWM